MKRRAAHALQPSSPPEPVLAPITLPTDTEIKPAMLRHLPLVREVIDRIGIHETIDRMLPRNGRMIVSDADCVSLMIINNLHGRVALYKMGEWLEGTDVDVVLDEGCRPDAL